MRKIFQVNVAQGACMYWGYGAPPDKLDELIEAIKASDRPSSVCVEQHMTGAGPESGVLREHEMLKELRGLGAAVHQVTRVREPLDFYLLRRSQPRTAPALCVPC